MAPAIKYADDGFVLDETLPSSVAEGRQSFQKYTASARIYLPNGRVPRPGDRFVNRDYAATLRTIASDGAQAFYRGSIAKRIAADMQVNGGLITEADLAQYRAIERKPVSGRYRGHVLYTGGPPVERRRQSLLEALQILGNYGAAAAGDGRARRRLLALPDRVVEGARSDRAHRRSRRTGRLISTITCSRRTPPSSSGGFAVTPPRGSRTTPRKWPAVRSASAAAPAGSSLPTPTAT